MILCGFTNYSFELRGQDEYYMVKFGYFTYTALKKNLNTLNSMSKIQKHTQESSCMLPLYTKDVEHPRQGSVQIFKAYLLKRLQENVQLQFAIL